MKYVALLRGINVGGNNKVSMPQLKQSFESLGFDNVKTYINSGNIIFDASQQDIAKVTEACEAVIEKDFSFHVTCCLISSMDLHDALSHAPSWWGIDDESKHNAIFVVPPLTPVKIMKEVGNTKSEYEKIATYGSVIFWSAPLKTFGRTRYSKIVGTSAYKFITIRNYNTFKKLVELTAR